MEFEPLFYAALSGLIANRGRPSDGKRLGQLVDDAGQIAAAIMAANPKASDWEVKIEVQPSDVPAPAEVAEDQPKRGRGRPPKPRAAF